MPQNLMFCFMWCGFKTPLKKRYVTDDLRSKTNKCPYALKSFSILGLISRIHCDFGAWT